MKLNNDKYRIYDQMISSFYNDEQNATRLKLNNSENIKIEPILINESNQKKLKVGFKIGDKNMYKIKSIIDFYKKMKENETYKYGLKLNLTHSRGAFEKIETHATFILKLFCVGGC